ncbi:MAG: hypothetical protein HOC05_17080, partial [Gemmatimonadetes bacterium]|nr:hypothetical protein [Gemmatimonadota bacterium]
MSNRAWQTARSHSWCKTVVTALLLLPVVATAADLRIRAELLHLRQTGPTSDYKIYGAPGAAPSLTDIDALYASGDAETIVRSAVDGSFAMLVDYAKAKDGLSVIARGVDSTESDPVALRLDYPRQGGMGGPPNARGFFNIVPATADVASESKPWIEASRALSQTGVFPVDARQLPLAGLDTLAMGTDLIIYGHSPDGDAATCVIGPTGFWVS